MKGDLELNITVVGRHERITSAMKEYARQKANKLTRYFDRIHKIEVIMDAEGDNYVTEMVATASRGHQFVGKAVEPDMLAAIDLVCDKMECQITRYKEKVGGKRPLKKRVPKPIVTAMYEAEDFSEGDLA